MSLPLALSEGVSVILVMLVVGLIFLAVIILGELTHHFGEARKERRLARRARY
ncbi:MAG TPA: hypothetical protein VLN26_17555 [Gaiellaceae bacterium]|nr:hypothetical protein [Gaiellaceae bacterium]